MDKVELRNDMLLLVEKHSKMTHQDRSLENVSKRLKVIKQALEIVEILEPKNVLDRNDRLIFDTFVSCLTAKVQRSMVWKAYVDVCNQHFLPVPLKGEFFDALCRTKFSKKTFNGHFYFVPPPDILDKSVKQLSHVDIVDSFNQAMFPDGRLIEMEQDIDSLPSPDDD